MSASAVISRRRGGFTLIEVLLALGLLAALLVAMNQFTFAIAEAWTKGQERQVFRQHTRAVARHVAALLETAADRARASNSATGGPAMTVVTLPQGAGTAPLLAFDLPEGDRLFSWPGAPLPEVWCALAWSADDGLVLYWKSRLETDFDTADPRRAVVSPFVTAVSYDYYDETAGAWAEKPAPEPGPGGTYLAPGRLHLHFARGADEVDEVVDLPPVAPEGLPAY